MHLRLSSAIGTPVVDERTQEHLGNLSGVLIHPDTAKIEGFFVRVHAALGGGQLFLSSGDIRSWGLRIGVADADRLAPAEDIIRLKALLDDPRTVVGQRIRTEDGKPLGWCKDVQFDTRQLHVEWLFPRKWFRTRLPIPVSEILEVKPEAIMIKSQMPPIAEPQKENVTEPTLLKVPEMA